MLICLHYILKDKNRKKKKKKKKKILIGVAMCINEIWWMKEWLTCFYFYLESTSNEVLMVENDCTNRSLER